MIYRHSRISTFGQCPLKFKFTYINQVPVEGRELEAVAKKGEINLKRI